MPDQDQILLHTKLHRPRLPHDLVLRPRLVEWLDQGLHYPLTLVCAAAGFGKTTLVSNWLEGMESLPSAWLSLDENDSDLSLFLSYFIAALRTMFPDACEQTLALVNARGQPPRSTLHATFSNELNDLPGEFVFVLDDYHTIHGEEVHELLSELTSHWPAPLHLVLVSRIDPPIPVNALRAKGLVHDIRTGDLRYTTEESAAFLKRSQAASLSQDELTLLENRFEGWPAGLRLVSLSFPFASRHESLRQALPSENADLVRYVVDEVITRQLPAIHTFLLKTSILDRYCAPLCEAVVEKVDPAWTVRACLDWIERSELFIVSLDNRREWYRYHHLFQELLQQSLMAEIGPAGVHALHRRASIWFEEHGLIEEALHHALAAGDLDLAARQMSAGLREVLNREDRPTLERWLRMLPEEVIQRHPELLMIRAWALQFAWRLGQQAQVVRQVEELLNSETGGLLAGSDVQTIRGQILLIKAEHAYFANRCLEAIDLCRQVLALFPASWNFVRGGAMFYLSLSMGATGQAQEAERLLLEKYEFCSDKGDIYALILLQSLCFTHFYTGQLEQTRRVAHTLVQNSMSRDMSLMKLWGDWFLGMVAYLQNDLQAAAQYFTSIAENRYIAQISAYRDAVAGLALIHQIKGESLEATQWVESVSQYDLEQSGSEDERTRSLRARLMLMQGDLEGAGRWVDTYSGPPPDMALLLLEEPQVTRVRILVARGSGKDLQSALQILEVLEDIIDRTHNTSHKIEVLALRALALDAQGNSSEASVSLQQAVELSRASGLLQVFVELGKPMQEMLGRLAVSDHLGATIQRILAAFPGDAVSESPAEPVRGPLLNNLTLPEPLTKRELEILALLRTLKSIKDIAFDLSISPATVRSHTINIYAKLGVNNRWKAVARAEELNILPSS